MDGHLHSELGVMQASDAEDKLLETDVVPLVLGRDVRSARRVWKGRGSCSTIPSKYISQGSHYIS